MLLRTHLVIAVFLFLALFNFIPGKFSFFLFLIFATIFVDLDSRKSRIGRKWFFRPLQWFVSHRGMFHSLIFGFILSGLVYFVNKWGGMGFLSGYTLHLILDCFTKSGVKVFWPFSSMKIRGALKSGGLIEEILFVLIFLADIFLIFRIFLISYV